MKKEVLDKLHTAQLEMLDFIDDYCKRNNLKYYLGYGTLLGAVRHQGFIPWDDDADIVMPRKDFDFLAKNISKELGEKYFLQTSYTDKFYGRDFAKIRMNNTIFLEEVDAHVVGRHHGIFLDIFIIEDCHKKPNLIDKFKFKIYQIVDNYIVLKTNGASIPSSRKILGILPLNLLVKIRDFNKKGKGDYWFLDKVGIGPKSDYEPSLEVPFEGRTYRIPNNYEKILELRYGDYKKLPPIEKRVTHNPVRISFNTEEADEQL